MGIEARETRPAPELTPAQRAMDARDWSFAGTWPYEPRWLFTDGIRLHYVDEGQRRPDAVVLLHGTPYWAYAFRDEIASRVGRGERAVAYDQLGFGRSDKPQRESEYSLERDVSHLAALVRELALDRVRLVAQSSAMPIATTFSRSEPAVVEDVEEREELPLPPMARSALIGRLLLKGARAPLRKVPLEAEERAAYLAPHPSWESRSGIVASLRRQAA